MRDAVGNSSTIDPTHATDDGEPARLSLPWHWLAAAYVPMWTLSASVSEAFWYLPAGLRLALIWSAPRHRIRMLWPIEVAALGLAVAWNGYNPLYSQLSTAAALLLWTVNLLGPMACYLGAVWMTSSRGARLQRMQPSDLERLLAAALLGSVASGLMLWLRDAVIGWSFDQPIAPLPWVFVIGDFIGCLVVAPLLLAGLCPEPQAGAPRGYARLLALGLLPAAIAMLGALALRGEALLLVLALTLAALIMAAYAQGWKTAALGLAGLSALTHVMPVAQALVLSPWVLHVWVAAVGVGALLLGASVDALRRRITQAVRLTREVQQAQHELKAASARLVGSEEAERQRVARELHDGLGQSLTALRTRSYLLQKGHGHPLVAEGLQEIDTLAALAHDELRAVLKALNPVELERLGFERALFQGSVAGMLADSGLAFECRIDDSTALDPVSAAHLYRICQEAASNVVRAGRARSFGVHLFCEGSLLHLHICDDGGSIRTDTGSGQGLQAIRDRATALGADYVFDADGGTPRHRLVLLRRE